MPDSFVRLCDAEERIKDDLVKFLAVGKIAHVDVTAALEEQIYKHVQIYPANTDAHPQAIGYGVIARAVFEALRAPQLGERR